MSKVKQEELDELTKPEDETVNDSLQTVDQEEKPKKKEKEKKEEKEIEKFISAS